MYSTEHSGQLSDSRNYENSISLPVNRPSTRTRTSHRGRRTSPLHDKQTKAKWACTTSIWFVQKREAKTDCKATVLDGQGAKASLSNNWHDVVILQPPLLFFPLQLLASGLFPRPFALIQSCPISAQWLSLASTTLQERRTGWSESWLNCLIITMDVGLYLSTVVVTDQLSTIMKAQLRTEYIVRRVGWKPPTW